MGRNRDFESRMMGMIYAQKILKESGMETGPLDKEIKMRGITKLEVNLGSEAVYDQWKDAVGNLYANMLTCFFYTLNESEGWGSVRIKRLKDEFDKNVKTAVDLDYLGEHYTTIGDYAKELNEKYGLGIDLTRLSRTQEYYDKGDVMYHKVKVERLIEMLEAKGYQDAADYIKSRLMEGYL